MKNRKIVLDHNEYYKQIIRRVEEVEEIKRTGRNRVILIDNLKSASEDLLCK